MVRSPTRSSRKRPGRPFFCRYVESQLVPAPDAMKILPLAHGTKAIVLRDIIASGRIRLPDRPCEVLGEKLIFAYYGRPSYRVGDNANVLKRPAGAPSYLLLKPKVMEHAAKAHPLDTGAFPLGLYKFQIESELSAIDFGFSPTLSDITKIVFHFFGDNNAYMANQPRSLNIPNGHDEAQAYFDVISSNSADSRDPRDSSIEIALDHEIEITPTNVQCAILPNVLNDADDYGKRLNDLGIDVRLYTFTRGYKPDDHAARVLDAVIDYYNEKSLL